MLAIQASSSIDHKQEPLLQRDGISAKVSYAYIWSMPQKRNPLPIAWLQFRCDGEFTLNKF